jgi:membrane-anchored protein YejM (alkaline phosphatase superfamily)
LALVLATLVTEKSIYAKADLLRDRTITSRSRMYPFYKRLTVKRLVEKWFDYDLAERPRVDVSGESLTLRYPIARPAVDPAGPRPNVLIVVVDSLRRDMLDARFMPRLEQWSHGARRFDQHVSGGNATRFGLFALIYGLHGAYWMPIYGDQRPPVLVEVLSELGYDMRVLSSASMSYPELRSTAWVTMEDRVEDDYPMRARNQRDEHLAERFDTWLAERAARAAPQPFFAFCLLDSPHQPYWVAPDLTPFEPYSERIDYLGLAGDPGPEAKERVFNRYKNAVAHADRVLGRMLGSLERHGAAGETLVVVTGDHGEEFFEHGHFGHTSNFTFEQVGVPFLLGGPGVPPGVERRPTAHVDLPATLLELLGADPAARADWSLGHHLLDPPESRLLVVAGWDELGLLVDGGILYLPLEGHKGSVEGYLPDWTPHPEEDEFLRANAGATARLLVECRRFLR